MPTGGRALDTSLRASAKIWPSCTNTSGARLALQRGVQLRLALLLGLQLLDVAAVPVRHAGIMRAAQPTAQVQAALPVNPNVQLRTMRGPAECKHRWS